MLTRQEYNRLTLERMDIIRANAGRRLKGEPQLPVPPKPDIPQVVELSDSKGEYVGTWPIGVSVEDAKSNAIELGYPGPFKVRYRPAMNW